MSEGWYEAEASDRGTVTATRAGALRGLVPNGVSSLALEWEIRRYVTPRRAADVWSRHLMFGYAPAIRSAA